MSSPADLNGEPSGQGQTRPLGVLPPGYLVAEFRIERVLGQGGFGIVYLAFDTRLERLVAVKEFMPQSLAQRLADHAVVPLSERHRATFELGLRSFIREARSLAQFKHPALVEVYRFWEALGTAYMVMPFYEGQTLKQRLDGMAAAPPEPWLRALLERVLEGLDVVHQQGWLHRDIAPDNILLLPGDRPLLLDFGSARQDIGDATQALAGLLKPGYAPFEQYGDSAALKQGPWTDLYALGAMLYFAICRKVPVPSVERVKNDTLVAAQVAGRRHCSPAFLQFIDQCLAVWPEQRPRNIAAALELLRELDAREKALKPKNTGQKRQDAGPARFSRNHTQCFRSLLRRRGLLPWAGGMAVLFAAVGGLVAWQQSSSPAADTVRTAQTAPQPDPVPATPIPADHSASLPGEWSSGTPTAAKPDMPAPPLPAPQVAEAAPPAPTPVFYGPATPEKALENLVDQRDPNIHVVVAPVSGKQKSTLQFTVKASEPGFLYVFAAGPQRGRLELLWPTDDESLLRFERRQAWTVDVAAHAAAGSPGKRPVGVMVSRAARHLAGAGWQRQAGVLSKSFSDSPETAAAPWFGLPSCPPVPGSCNSAYGAVRLELTSSQPDVASSPPASKNAGNPNAARWRQMAARKAECESLAHLLSLDGNVLAQRRFAQLGCRR